MLSINTNLSSLIAQNSMNKSTNALELAIERMTTGYKINHASDNAANYSIATNMDTQIGSYEVAADNVAMGMDLVTTANDTISLMQDKAERLRALCTQARNGTYGAQSMQAINSEANAIMAEINRLYSTAEYNGVSLFTGGTATTSIAPAEPAPIMMRFALPRATTSPESSFIDDPKTYTDEEVAAMKTITQAIAESSLVSGGTYSISTVDELVALADYVNAKKDTTGMTFVLGADIDLSSISNWTPIGYYKASYDKFAFKGTFDGNGHVIKNLKIDRDKLYQGLFAYTASGSEIKNVGIEGGSVKGNGNVGGLVGYSEGSVTNSYAMGNVTIGTNAITGGLVGYSEGSVTNSYATGTVNGTQHTGGLVGYSKGSITNSYATGNVTGTANSTGGLVGQTYSSSSLISNSYATGTVSGTEYVGGLVGGANSTSISNSYATGNVTGSSNRVGGLVGFSTSSSISNSYATGTVSGTRAVGGLTGENSGSGSINDSYATGDVTGTGQYVGGLVGEAGSSIISNSYATGTASGTNPVGGLVGSVGSGGSVTNSAAVQSDSKATVMTEEQIKSTYTLESMGFTEANGWTMVNGQPLLSWQKEAQPTPTPDPGPTPSPGGGSSSGSSYGVNAFCLQIGINGDNSCQIGFDINFTYDLSVVEADIASDEALATIDDFIMQLSEQETKLGAVQNRLESAFDSITVNIQNLTSSLSTIRDADIAEVSSEYIRQQILQQASTSLMATANQSPAIALQLI